MAFPALPKDDNANAADALGRPSVASVPDNKFTVT
jgi:hypothetical protein